MKQTMKTIKSIFLVFTAALIFAGCTEDPVLNPPTAQFTLSNMEPVQWDESVIISTAIGADEISYTVTGGNFNMVDGIIQFLDAKTYTVTQTVTNTDGTNEASVEVVVTEPNNTYTLDGTEMPLSSIDNPNAFWFLSTMTGATPYLRILADVAGQDNPNLFKFYPVTAVGSPLQGTYTWSDSKDAGTYDAGMTANYAGFSYDWTTNGDDGTDLVIELVYEDPSSTDDNIYDIMCSSYTLNYGDWDYSTYTWMSDGTKPLVISYRGKIDPVN